MSEQTTLYFKDGSSDKIYQAAIEAEGDGFVVTFAYGRRGAKLTTGTKTKSPVSRDVAKAIFDKLISEKTSKGYTLEEGAATSKPKRMKWKHDVSNVSHCQFYIEPKERPETFHQDHTDQEFAQGFTSYPTYAIFHCDDVWQLELDAEVTDRMPSIDDCVQAACLPIEVIDDHGLYIRTVENDLNEHKIGVPRGKYDMVVRIFETEGPDFDSDDDDDDEDPHCKASLSSLPSGKVGPKCFKRDGFELPSHFVIHTSDGGTEEYPVEG